MSHHRNLYTHGLDVGGGDACYYLVQNIVTSLISKNAKSNTYRTIILPAVLYGVKLGLSHSMKILLPRN